MNDVLLISENMLHYRISLYNEFYKMFKQYQLRLFVYSNKKGGNREILFNMICDKYSFQKIRRTIIREDPAYIILFWNIYTVHTWLLVFWLKLTNRPFIYWGQGVSMKNKSSYIKNFLYGLILKLSSAIVLYSKNEKEIIKSKEKAFVANNTINLNDIPEITSSVRLIKEKYNINYKKVVLFVGRIQKRKKLDILINLFIENKTHDIGLVIVGSGMSDKEQMRLKKHDNITYLGELYGSVNEIFKMADIFCIPGTNGLGINQAMYWGLPVLTIEGFQNPEIVYVKNGETGFILKNKSELWEKITQLLNDDDLLAKMSKRSKEVIIDEASVEKMFSGFINSIEYVDNKN